VTSVLVNNMALIHRLRAYDATLAKRIEDDYLNGKVGPHVTNKRLLEAIAKAVKP
jgi:hypothetical protein